ncbi:MAG: GNAT family N-acetyltransferase, partial [Gaiellales bacterium]
MPRITTERLILRRWTPADYAPFAAINADPLVMRYFPAPYTRAQSDARIDQIEDHFDVHGFGLWAVERRADGKLLGYTGLQHVPFDAAFTPAVEIAWRLARDAWGRGYATEAAQAVLAAGFEQFGLEEIVAMAVQANTASIAVMRRIGMQHDPAGDFDSPRLEPGSRLLAHVLYRTSREPKPAPPIERGAIVHDLRHAFSVELRPDPTLDASLRELAARLEAAGLLAAGAATAPRFHPHLTLLRASDVSAAALDAVAASVQEQGRVVTFTRAGTFGSGRIIWLAPSE